MPRSFVLKFYSTAAMERDRLVAFAAATKHLFGAQKATGEFTDDRHAGVTSFEDIESFFASDMPEWIGCLTIAFGDGNGLSGRCDLLRLRRERTATASLGSSANYRAHEFTIEIAGNRRDDTALRRRLVDYVVTVATLLDASFAFGNDDDGTLASLHSPRGLEAGLPGIFRLTVLGREFAALIGTASLLSLPVQRATRLNNGAVMIQLDDDVFNTPPAALSEQRDVAREAIGADYFADLSPAPLELGGGTVGLWSAVRAFFRSQRDYAAPHRLARRRPVIDWSGVFADSVRTSE